MRNHLLSAPDIGFDCVSEFWPAQMDATFALMQTKVGERMREDERQFADQPRIVSGRCEEIRLAGGARPDDEAASPSWRCCCGLPLDATTLVGSLHAWAADTAAPGRSVTLDRVSGMPPAAFPCDAILWLHAVDVDPDPRLPAGIEIVGRALTEAEETPAAVLAMAGSETPRLSAMLGGSAGSLSARTPRTAHARALSAMGPRSWLQEPVRVSEPMLRDDQGRVM